MDHVNLGNTGLRVSRLGLGMMSYGNDSERPWVLDEDAAEPIVRAAVDAGVTFFDTADVYGDGRSERLIATLLRERDESLVVATKFGRRAPLEIEQKFAPVMRIFPRAIGKTDEFLPTLG